jgi:hypothetical protein
VDLELAACSSAAPRSSSPPSRFSELAAVAAGDLLSELLHAELAGELS